MNNKKIFFTLVFILAILYIGLEILPQTFNSEVVHVELEKKSVKPEMVQKACLGCHSIKYDDNFKYDEAFYKTVQKEYAQNPPKDISLLKKRYSELELYHLLSNVHKPKLEDEKIRDTIVYMYENKQEKEQKKVGYLIIFYLMILALFVYFKILLQNRN